MYIQVYIQVFIISPITTLGIINKATVSAMHNRLSTSNGAAAGCHATFALRRPLSSTPSRL